MSAYREGLLFKHYRKGFRFWMDKFEKSRSDRIFNPDPRQVCLSADRALSELESKNREIEVEKSRKLHELRGTWTEWVSDDVEFENGIEFRRIDPFDEEHRPEMFNPEPYGKD